MMDKENKDYLCLKWGTLKGWKFNSENCCKLMEEYSKIGASWGAAQQDDTPRQKEIIIELIDACDADEIYLDWDGKWVSKEEAKKYVMEYGKDGAK